MGHVVPLVRFADPIGGVNLQMQVVVAFYAVRQGDALGKVYAAVGCQLHPFLATQHTVGVGGRVAGAAGAEVHGQFHRVVQWHRADITQVDSHRNRSTAPACVGVADGRCRQVGAVHRIGYRLGVVGFIALQQLAVIVHLDGHFSLGCADARLFHEAGDQYAVAWG